MRVVTAALCLVVLGPLALSEVPQDRVEGDRKVQRLQSALEWVDNADPEVREMGRQVVLAEFGRAALPAIERRLQEKGALDLVKLAREFDRAARPVEPWVAEKDLREITVDEQYLKELQKLPKDAPEKYVHVKYAEAMAHTRQKNYQRGYDMAHALTVLEPKSPNAEAVKRLRRYCETMITQTTLIEAKVVQPKIWYVAGEPIELSARMKNLYRSPMTLTYDKGTPQEPGGGLLVVEVEVTMAEMGGHSSADTRHMEIRFEEEVPIAPGAQWERKFTLDDGTAIEDQEQIRTITVNAWSQPAKIATDGANVTRRIQFEPSVIKVIPKKYASFLENPLEWLGKTMDTGTAQEVFLCSQMLEPNQKEPATEMLIRWMAKADPKALGRVAAGQILAALTGQRLGEDPKKWAEWFQARDKDKEKKKK